MGKKIAIFLSAGIGDAVLMIPLLKKIKSNGHKIHIILDTIFINKEFLEFNNYIYDELTDLHQIKVGNFICNNFQRFDQAFLDYSSSSVKNVFLSTFISKRVIAMRKKHIFFPNVTYRNEKYETHAAVLNIQLFDKEYKGSDFDISQLKLTLKNDFKPDIIRNIETDGKIPVVIQASSANMKAPYKNWPVENWISLINKNSLDFPHLFFILMGDESEISIGKQIENGLKGSFINLIGKTELTEMCNILYFSKLYVGLDSGLMHLAVAYGIPTFSIFGASSYHFVGYEKFDSKKHKVIYNPIKCWPCHGFSKTNKTRVKNPNNCPDLECLIDIKPEKVINEFKGYYSKIQI